MLRSVPDIRYSLLIPTSTSRDKQRRSGRGTHIVPHSRRAILRRKAEHSMCSNPTGLTRSPAIGRFGGLLALQETLGSLASGGCGGRGPPSIVLLWLLFASFAGKKEPQKDRSLEGLARQTSNREYASRMASALSAQQLG